MAYLSTLQGADGSGASSDQVAVLQAQVNRFHSEKAPAMIRFEGPPLKLTGVLDPGTVAQAMAIGATRYAELVKISTGADRTKYALYATGFATHMADAQYLAEHLKEAIEIVGLYGDSLGLPPPSGTRFTSSNYKLAAIVGGVGLLLWWSSRKGRRR